MEAVSPSETSANIYHITGRKIPEDSHLRTRSRENIKTHPEIRMFVDSSDNGTVEIE
jgi:hypothetical protein